MNHILLFLLRMSHITVLSHDILLRFGMSHITVLLGTGHLDYNYLSLPLDWEALEVSQHTELVFCLDVELPVVTPRSRPAAALSPEPLGVRGVGGVGAAPADLLGLGRRTYPNFGASFPLNRVTL